ncbi:MAG: hypothetical protein ACK5PQ_00040 [Alphaproteobacteria bacterium]
MSPHNAFCRKTAQRRQDQGRDLNRPLSHSSRAIAADTLYLASESCRQVREKGEILIFENRKYVSGT